MEKSKPILAANPIELTARLREIEPPKSHDMSEWNKHQREQRHVSRVFSSASLEHIFPMEVVQGESPDFSVTATRARLSIGIEVTELMSENEVFVQALNERGSLQHPFLFTSHECFKSGAPRFKDARNPLDAIRRELEVSPEDIRSYNRLVRTLDWGDDELMDETIIHLKQAPPWSNNQREVDIVAALKKRVEDKTAKLLTTYEKRADNWLVVKNRLSGLQTNEDGIAALKKSIDDFRHEYWTGLSTFARVFVIFQSQIVELHSGASVWHPLVDHWYEV